MALESELKKDNASVHSNNDDSAKSTKEEGQVTPVSAYIQLWSFATPLDTVLRTIAALCSAGSGTAEPLMAIFFGNLVNLFNGTEELTPDEFRRRVNRNSLYFVYLFIGKFFLIGAGALLWSYTATRMTSRIRLRYLRTVLHRPIAYFDTRSPGAISTSLATDTNIVQVGLSEKIGIVFQVASMILTSFIISFTRNWKLTLVTATVVPYMMVSTGFFGSLNATAEGHANQALSRASGVAEEALSSILNITAMGAKSKLLQRFDVHTKQAKHYALRLGPLMALIYGNMFLAMHCAYALCLFYGVKLIARGEMTNGGDIVTVLFCMLLASSSMSFLAPLIPDFSKAAGSAQAIMQAIGEKGKDNSSADTKPELKLESLQGDILIQDVSFSYPERPTVTVLKDMNLSIPRNKSTALVGHSGSGKSTIIGLLERWYSSNKGSIQVDGQDILQLDLKWWRSQIGLVQQEPALFNDTIYNNVLNGLRGENFAGLTEEKKRELVMEACKQANAHEFITRLPNGYDTFVGERASLLSGGQKQRVAIARAIVSNPQILLFDEATSALDTESERAVQIALEKVSKGRTTVTVAHKLSTIANADNIVVLSKGVIVEQGTHSELEALDGHYCRLLQAQRSSPDTFENQITEKEDAITKTVSRKLTRHTTAGTVDGTGDKMESPLEAQDISRRIGFFHSIYIVYTEQPQLIWLSVIGLLAGIAGGAGFPLQAWFFSRLVTVFNQTGEKLIERGNFWALMFFILGLSQLFSYLVLLHVMGVVGSRVGQIYRHKYLEALLKQDIAFFQSGGNTSGGLSALMSQDTLDVEMLFRANGALVVVFVTNIISCSILALAVYWKLGLVAIFGCLPVLLLAGFMRMRIDLGAQNRMASSFLESARFSTEAVAAIRTVSSLTMESKVEALYQEKLSSANTDSTKKSTVGVVLYAVSESLTLAASALCFWYGGRLMSFNELSSAQFFIIFGAIIFGGQSAGIMFGFTSSMSKAHAGLNRILYLTRSNPVINSSTGADPRKGDPPSGPVQTVEFQDVHFRYPSRPTIPVLRGLSLSVPRGSYVCIVGPSGCGKSTVVALIERFYDVGVLSEEKDADCGEILVYGRPIREWDISALRKMMGLVAQDTTLYQGTIRDNILLGLDDTEIAEIGEELEARITRACTEANIDDFIRSLPEGYGTEIGSRGVALSGGQRQRLALARCLIRNPQILLLDEATSALDPESQRGVRDALINAQKERPDLTVISVTHQVESMRDADTLFVVDKGVVAEQGNWDVLMERKGRLWGMVVQGQVEG